MKEQVVVSGKVERFGQSLIVPEEMPLETAAKILHTQMVYEEQTVDRSCDFNAHPFDVAYAFGMAIDEVTGAKLGKAIETWFKSVPPKEISVHVGPEEYVRVLWGQIVFPFDPENGHFQTGFNRKSDGTIIGSCQGHFKQKYLPVWEQVIKRTRELLASSSIFRGKVLRVKFDAQVPEVEPWDVRKLDVSKLVFSSDLEQQIEDHVLTPIRHREKCELAGTPFKRGILLTGTYGTGKTLLAGAVAKLAAQHGLTVLYIEDVKQLPQALRMAATLAPAIVFAEDIDRITDGERTHEIDLILNTLDGIDTKSHPVMTILTSNYPDKIYKGMIRPGRIDVALKILPPDSEAAQRLVKGYLGSMFNDDNGNLEEMGNALAGQISAVIREICERSKLSYISRTGETPTTGSITPDDVLRANGSMKNQLTLLDDREKKPTVHEQIGKFFQGVSEAAENTKRTLELAESIDSTINQ